MIFNNIVLFIALTFFCSVRLLTYLHILQQDEYDPIRFLVWIYKNKGIDIKASIAIGVFALITHDFLYLYPAIFCILPVIAFFEIGNQRKTRKWLVMTWRAKRIFYSSVAVCCLINFLVLNHNPILIILAIQMVPLVLCCVCYILLPIEKYINRSFISEASYKLSQVNPIVIGITGSYGKTSVKHIIGHIIGTLDSALMTPGSVNTVLGIVRIIRDSLTRAHKFFIVEMGAYRIGSIKKICKIVNPVMCIITAIDIVHYERFKSLASTAKAKLELAEVAIKAGGKAFISEKMLSIDIVKSMYDDHKDSFIVYEQCVKINKFIQTRSGLDIEFTFQDQKYSCSVPIYGACNVNSILISFVFAVYMGFDALDVIASLKTLHQTPHRMEVKHFNNYTLIDNAYSSNPEGVKSSLMLLDVFYESNGRRIMITPGMVELGSRHDEEHVKFAKLAVQHTDIVIVVMPKRIMSFVNTYIAEKRKEQTIIFADSFGEADEWVQKNVQKNDVVLIENDLLDVYEKRKSFL